MLIRHNTTGQELEVPDETNLAYFPGYEKTTSRGSATKSTTPRKTTARKSTPRKTTARKTASAPAPAAPTE